MGFSYDVHEGVVKDDEPDGQDLWLIKYGFVPDKFVPILGQYQAIRNPDIRHLPGTTFWLGAGVWAVNKMVIFLDPGGGGYLRRGSRHIIALGGNFPKSPFGILFRAAGWISVGIIAYDYYVPLMKTGFKQFLSALNPMNYNPFLA